jgi:hypothetical protein
VCLYLRDSVSAAWSIALGTEIEGARLGMRCCSDLGLLKSLARDLCTRSSSRSAKPRLTIHTCRTALRRRKACKGRKLCCAQTRGRRTWARPFEGMNQCKVDGEPFPSFAIARHFRACFRGDSMAEMDFIQLQTGMRTLVPGADFVRGHHFVILSPQIAPSVRMRKHNLVGHLLHSELLDARLKPQHLHACRRLHPPSTITRSSPWASS